MMLEAYSAYSSRKEFVLVVISAARPHPSPRYEIEGGCTSIVAQDADGHVVHGRTGDAPNAVGTDCGLAVDFGFGSASGVCQIVMTCIILTQDGFLQASTGPRKHMLTLAGALEIDSLRQWRALKATKFPF